MAKDSGLQNVLDCIIWAYTCQTAAHLQEPVIQSNWIIELSSQHPNSFG